MTSNNDNDVVYEKIINKKNCISQFIIRWLNFMYAILYEQFLKFSHILLVEIEIKQHLMNLTIKGTIWQEMIFQYSSIITKRCPKIKKKSIKDITQVVYAANDIKKSSEYFLNILTSREWPSIYLPKKSYMHIMSILLFFHDMNIRKFFKFTPNNNNEKNRSIIRERLHQLFHSPSKPPMTVPIFEVTHFGQRSTISANSVSSPWYATNKCNERIQRPLKRSTNNGPIVGDAVQLLVHQRDAYTTKMNGQGVSKTNIYDLQSPHVLEDFNYACLSKNRNSLRTSWRCFRLKLT